jgi:prophage regulatory protein
MPECLLRQPQLLRRVSISRTSLQRMMAAGTFPKPQKIGARAVAWRESDIENWIASRFGPRTSRHAERKSRSAE